MEKSKSQKNALTIVQPNSVTYARYDFDEREENILTLIFDALQKHLTREKLMNKDIFNKFYISITDIKSSTEKRNYEAALEKMVKKTVKFDWNKPDAGMVQTTATIFTAYHVYKNERRIDITLNEWAVPYLLYWGKGVGGTLYNRTTALTITGKYTKRIYKMCCRWADQGGFAISLDEFKKMLAIPKSYNKGTLENRILNNSMKELNETADVSFTYSFSKKNGSRSYNFIEFKVFPNSKNINPSNQFDIESKGKEYALIYKVVTMAYPNYINANAQMVTDRIASDLDTFHKAYKRFKSIFDDIKNGTPVEEKIGLIKHIIDKDFGFQLMKKSNVKINVDAVMRKRKNDKQES